MHFASGKVLLGLWNHGSRHTPLCQGSGHICRRQGSASGGPGTADAPGLQRGPAAICAQQPEPGRPRADPPAPRTRLPPATLAQPPQLQRRARSLLQTDLLRLSLWRSQGQLQQQPVRQHVKRG